MTSVDDQAAADARRWLAEAGVRQVDGEWIDDEDGPVTANDVAHTCMYGVLADEDLDASGRLRIAFGMLDLLDDYWVTAEIRMARANLPSDLIWDGYRRRLEAPRDAEPVTYSLWVDWFEDRKTSATAFAEVLGDIDRLRADPSDALLRRARRVLECSGPVPWTVKEGTYRVAAQLPDLHPALFKGLLTSYHDFYGDLEPAAALALLAELDLPADTEHLTKLRAVLTAGHENHYRSPNAWTEA